MKNNNITVIGLGISGKAAVRLAAAKGYAVTGIDESSAPKLAGFTAEMSSRPGITIMTGFKEPQLPPSDLIVISPGVADDSYLGKLAAATGTKITSELDFASGYITAPMLAVTGTNGKTTVTEMTTQILQESGLKAISAGNIGLPLSEAALDQTLAAIVVEVSSFQLEKAENFTPLAAAVLNVESDHMNRYATFADYTDTKLNIFANVKDPGKMLININLLKDWNTRFTDEYPDQKPLTFSAVDRNADINLKDRKVCFSNDLLAPVNLDDSEIRSLHNIENLMAAIGLSSAIVAKTELEKAVISMVGKFRISPHRQEIVMEKDGVVYVNDSKATNPAAVNAALDQFGGSHNICLIAGGLDKKMDFSSVKTRSHKIKAIFLAGESKNLLATLWNHDIRCIICDSFEESVTKAAANAEPGDVVLLSPGCASMDLFKNYKERGEKFKKILQDIQ